ncbi:hypothetical protein INT45_010924 [Circinella minor]|uniref:Telomerase reverse transcriptase n=1 Tax=Circinella minor TaxID=1195481 RepID=A0A8H7S0X9_9FUNG|nr:hypothetical protein INT45_010924 [Circinella minor]
MELIKELLTDQRYEKVDSTSNNSSTAKIRFVPKGKNIRIITDMSNINRSNKSKLHKALKVLAYERSRKQFESVGKSVTNSLDLFEKLFNYKSNIFKGIPKDQKLHFVKTDVMSSFDSIDQYLLLEILKNTLEKQYNYKSFVTTYSRFGEINWKSELCVETPSTSSSSEKEIQKLAEKFTQSIWIEGPNHTSQNSEELLQLIADHIQNSIQGNNYRQTIGIPQGSCLSTMLCDHFYTQMENECLEFIKNDPNALLLRYVDDFLLITPNVTTIKRFGLFIEQGLGYYMI